MLKGSQGGAWGAPECARCAVDAAAVALSGPAHLSLSHALTLSHSHSHSLVDVDVELIVADEVLVDQRRPGYLN